MFPVSKHRNSRTFWQKSFVPIPGNLYVYVK
nr:MAG TPA: hypothetical protein [Caudoviricetes sp.]